MKRFLFLTSCFLFFATSLNANYWEFGQNKVQYEKFDWQVIDTDNFSIIYYPGGELLAEFAKSVLDDAYGSLSNALSHDPSKRIPVIIYKSANDFEQTNVTLSIIDENTGGFAESIKNRIVIHYNGNYEKFRHVLAHELTHPFQFSMTRGPGGLASLLSTTGINAVPLWFIEGMAEYFSLKWDAESDMIIRDLMYWNKLYPINKLYLISGSYPMYKEGQSVVKFIADRYGEKKIGEIFRKASRIGGINNAFEAVLGVDTKELNHLWMKELKKHYWALCSEKDEEPKKARRLTKHEGYFLNTASSISPDGTEIAFFSDRDRYESLYLMSAIDGRIKAKLIGGGKTRGFESLHVMQGGIGWHPNSKIIAFVAKTQGKDILYIMDVKQRKIIKQFKLELDRIFSPSFSPDGKFIAIRGVKDGAADIYILNYLTEELWPLTNDQYDDLTPSWSPDGKYIVFASDRPFDGEEWEYGKYTLFKLSKNAEIIEPQILIKSLERATYVAYPLWLSSEVNENTDSLKNNSFVDNIFFVSNRDGVNNLYVFNIGDTLPAQLTNVIGGIFTPSISKSGKLLAMSSYINSGWDIYILKNPLNKGDSPNPPKSYNTKYTKIAQDTVEIESDKLGLRFAPDWGGGAIEYSAGGNISGILRLAASDLLGNHRLYLETSSPNNILSSYNLTYFYLPQRLNLGVTTFKDEYYYWLNSDRICRNEILGGGLLLSCPTDKFHRADLELIAYKQEEETYFYQETNSNLEPKSLDIESYYQVATSLAWIYDNSVWGYTGPMFGQRGKISMYSTLPAIRPTLLYNLYKLDFRKYIGIGKRHSFAVRLMNLGIWGKDEEKMGDIWLGGSEDLRGYAIQDSIAGKNVGVLNLEFRYPFIDQINISFPVPIQIRGIRGALFCDFGYATDDTYKLGLYENGRLQDLKFDFGAGIRMRTPYFIVKFNCAWNSDFVYTSKQYLSISLMPEF